MPIFYLKINILRKREFCSGKRIIFFLYIFFSGINIHAQTAKELYKKGIEAQKKGQYQEAERSFSAAINLKKDYTEAYFERANCNFNLSKFELALPDYVYLHRHSPLNENYIIKAALTYMELKRWLDAQNMLLKLEADDMNLHIAEAKVKMAYCKIMLKNFEEAVQYLSENTSIFLDDDQIFFYKGVASDSLKDFQTAAISYSKSIEITDQKLIKKSINKQTSDSLKANYLLYLGKTQINMFDYVAAKDSYTKALKLSPNNAELYLTRASICLQKNELNEALEDLRICESLNLKTYAFFYTKARVLKKVGQFNKAIENLDPIISNDTAYHARFLKGQCLESIGKFEEAQIAYKFASIKVPIDRLKEIDAANKRMRNRVYEFKRESNAPFFEINAPSIDIDKKLLIPKSHQFVELKGKVDDKSLIKTIRVNDFDAEFEKDSLNPEFRIKIKLTDQEFLKIQIVDIYSNVTEQNFEFNRKEKNKPNHKLFITYSEKDKEIFFDKLKSKSVIITGRVEDESLIKRIMVNNKIATFNINENNPVFEASIEVSNIDSIKILIIDEYDNLEISSYYINSKKAIEMAQNPMGKTWLIFIANSNYENYATLTGPEKDFNLVNKAIGNYKFDNIISKRNMTLSEMEKFFRIELRDLVKEQGVNSIMIWFAGHGKYVNETGYWLPVNANKNDEISYYPIPYLRSNISGYGLGLRNILIVSDACESGPSFSLTDEIVANIDCTSLNSGKVNQSAIVFSSTTNEKASDNSVFCETFTDLLNSNPDACLSINNIVKAVSSVVEKRQNQRCKFGKIKDIAGNTGSFYFLKK